MKRKNTHTCEIIEDIYDTKMYETFDKIKIQINYAAVLTQF